MSYSYEDVLRVQVLAGEGFSQREIAERVLGDRRLHGRVDRILRRQRELRADPERELRELLARLETLRHDLTDADIPDLDELFELFLRRSLARRLDRDPESVRVSELAAVLRVTVQLERRRQYERVRRMTVRKQP